jgi:hypothetical protein
VDPRAVLGNVKKRKFDIFLETIAFGSKSHTTKTDAKSCVPADLLVIEVLEASDE